MKTKLLDSITVDEVVEFDYLNKEAAKIEDLKKAAEKIKRYEDIIKTKNKGIINVAYYQGQVFKRFKEKENFVKRVSELGIQKILSFLKLMFLNCVKNTPSY